MAKHNDQDLKKPYVFQPYPKILYRRAEGEDGDLVSPAYEKIKIIEGSPQRVPEFHPYKTRFVQDEEEEQAAKSQGWVEHPVELKVVPMEEVAEKRGPGRPRKQAEVE